ncbi:hypothetical protein BgiBS90_010068, partial [Biomphalaria glabrata]
MLAVRLDEFVPVVTPKPSGRAGGCCSSFTDSSPLEEGGVTNILIYKQEGRWSGE